MGLKFFSGWGPARSHGRSLALALVCVLCLAWASNALAEADTNADTRPSESAAAQGHSTPAIQGVDAELEASKRTDKKSASAESVLSLDADERRQFLRVLIPTSLLLALVIGFLLWEMRRRSRSNRRLSTASPLYQSRSGLEPVAGLAPLTKTSGRSRHVSTGELEVVSAHSDGGGERYLPQPTALECPRCGREFEGDVELCPFDGSDLAPRGSTPSPPRLPLDRVDTSTAQMVCPTCNAAFELGSAYCPYDGETLEHRLRRTPEAGEKTMRCPACGKECEAEASYCPNDQTRLVSKEPTDSDAHAALSLAPLKICTGCATEFPVSTEVCPECDEALHFMHGRKTAGRALPSIEGDSNICPECGERYACSLSYCVVDGTPLLALN